jgi:hypothetical protein
VTIGHRWREFHLPGMRGVILKGIVAVEKAADSAEIDRKPWM